MTKNYRVVVGSEADGDFEEAFSVKATYPKAAEFDAKLEAAQRFPFIDPADLVILSTKLVG